MTLWVLDAPAWAEVMKPELDALDQERAEQRRGRSGSRPAYSAEEIEKALLFGKICGFRTYKKTYLKLCADKKAREMLGFTRPNAKAATRHEDGVPSPATVSRHLARFSHGRRAKTWDRLARALRDFHVANFPEMQEEMRVSYIDGSRRATYYTTPKINPKTGEIVNADKVQCWDGGFMPWDAGEKKWGNGWKEIPLISASGVPWAWPEDLPKIHEGEVTLATQIARTDAKEVVALLDDQKLGIVTADTAFTGEAFRSALREIGFVENIHTVSHKIESEQRAEAYRGRKIPIDEYPNWFADGHRQLSCACGQGHTFSRFSITKDKRAVAQVEGSCKSCGSITITSGLWKFAKNPDRFTRIDPKNDAEEPDYLFGNPLTFDNPLASKFGWCRFGHNEGLFGTLWKRFRLGEKRWYRHAGQMQAEIGMIYSIIHVAAMEQRRRKQALAFDGPPDDV
jgi:transposase